MAVHIVRLGSPRMAGEGPRIGTVRRPPRGVRQDELASGNWYDVWFPSLAPSAELVGLAQAAKAPKEWAAFVRKYRAQMAAGDGRHAIALFATLSHRADFAVGCYCKDEARCHRSVLRELLAESGAALAPARRS